MTRKPSTDDIDRFWAIRKGVTQLQDPEAQQLFLDVTTKLVALLVTAESAGPDFDPLWLPPPAR